MLVPLLQSYFTILIARTDYAIAAAVPLTLANYLLVGWFNDDIDQFYLTSWKIFVGMAVVFNVLVRSTNFGSLFYHI